MIHQPHPTHARKTLRAMFVLMGLSVLPFGFAFYAADWLHDETLENWAVGVLMALWVGVMVVAALRMYVSRCPSCRRWLFRQAGDASGVGGIPFICPQCDIVWDSGISVDE